MEESISKNEKIREKFELLSVDCPMELVAQWAAKEQASERDYEKVASLLDGIKMLRDRNNCKMLRNMSGLPKVSRRTFDNFDVSRLSSANKDMFEHLKSLSFLDTGFNVVIIGDPGTGKTHIAQAIGNLCCDKLYSTRYYKMAELEKKLKKAIENDKASSLLENLSKVSCLIIDEVGHCDPLKERESNLFFKFSSASLNGTGVYCDINEITAFLSALFLSHSSTSAVSSNLPGKNRCLIITPPVIFSFVTFCFVSLSIPETVSILSGLFFIIQRTASFAAFG